MNDHKFERKYDRRLILEDDKNRILDFRDFGQEPPSVGIYDEPVRYFKANKEWCKFIFGFLTWMQDVAFWTEAEDTTYHAIQQIMIFEEGIEEIILMSPDELKAAICEAIECSAVKISARIVSGKTSGFEIDDDGNVVVGGDDAAELPEDDPTTPAIDESLAAQAGGVNGVTRGYNLIWSDMAEWKAAAVSTANMIQRLKLKYLMNDDPLTEQFVTAYETAWPSKVNSFTATLDGMLFCGAGNFKNTVATYIIETISDVLQPEAFALNNAIADEQITAWYNKGAQVPSTAYETYSCVKIQDETLNFDMGGLVNDVQITTAETWKKNHRMLVDASGTFVDADVPNVIYDAMWEINTVTGVKTFKPMTFNFPGGVVQPTSAEVPYRADHHYQYTVLKENTNSAGIVTVVNGSATLPNVTGIIAVTLKDMGEVIG